MSEDKRRDYPRALLDQLEMRAGMRGRQRHEILTLLLAAKDFGPDALAEGYRAGLRAALAAFDAGEYEALQAWQDKRLGDPGRDGS